MSAQPKHVAIIMDGNGRWAMARGKSRGHGHAEGAARVREITSAAALAGVQHLSLFAFSTENWRRPPSEVALIFRLLESYLRAEVSSLSEEGVRLAVTGNLEPLPSSLRQAIEDVCALTRDGARMELNLLVNYGGRQEIAGAVRALSSVTEESLAKFLTRDRPDPDLLIRTGGEHRLSNFMLWQAAYAEIYFAEQKWPDFRAKDFAQALTWYAHRERRYGALSAPVPKTVPKPHRARVDPPRSSESRTSRRGSRFR